MSDEIMVPLSEVLMALEDLEGVRQWHATRASSQFPAEALPNFLAYVGWFAAAGQYLEQTFNYPGTPSELVALGTGRIMRIHTAGQCTGTPCPFHAPTKHHMVGWPMSWQADRGLIERLCEHGISHPDPDSVAYLAGRMTWDLVIVGEVYVARHECDGCCASGGTLTKVGEGA